MRTKRNHPAREHFLREVRRTSGVRPRIRRPQNSNGDAAGGFGDGGNGKIHPVFIFRQEPKRGWTGVLKVVLPVALALMLAFPLIFFTGILGGGAATYAYFSSDLPPVEKMQTLDFETTKIYDRNGVLLYEIYDKTQGKRTRVSLDEVSPWVVKATVAVEDATFYSNPGIDLKGIARAVYIEYFSKGSSGGSTITQQLVRNVLLKKERYERTYTRKIREALLALEFNRRFTKDQIMEMYLNEVYYGNLAYGIEAAAQSYFGKLAKDLTLAEASMLAGLPQAPSAYDPTKNLSRSKKRQAIVLGLMAKQGYITEEEADAASSEELHFVRQTEEKILAPHFVHYVQQVLEDRYGAEMVNRGGLTVYTSIDLRYQAIAQKAVSDHVATLASSNVHNAALVAMKPKTGEILAMVGSVDYYDSSIDGQVNVAVSERQPGSSFKPIVYASAFKKGWSPGIVVNDAKMSIKIEGQPTWEPKNYDGKFRGWMSLRTALANSYNIPAVKVIQYVGLREAIATAKDMGLLSLKDESSYGPSLVLGGGEVKLLELTNAFGVFANGGMTVEPAPILKVLDTNGQTIYELDQKNPKSHRSLSPQIAYEITSILSDNKARATMFGTNSPLVLSKPAAAKTGTTNDYKDGWTMGYTPYLVTGVWTGNTNGDEMRSEPGVRAAAPIWHNFMEAVISSPELEEILKDSPDTPLQVEFVQPDGIVKTTICGETGLLASRSCPHVSTDIMPADMAPTKYCTGPHATTKYTPPPRQQQTNTSTPAPTEAAPTPSPRQSTPTQETPAPQPAEPQGVPDTQSVPNQKVVPDIPPSPAVEQPAAVNQAPPNLNPGDQPQPKDKKPKKK